MSWSVADEFVRRFPRQRFVLDHLAKPPIKNGNLQSWACGIRELAQAPNVFAKLSGLVTEADWQNWKPEHIIPCLDIAFECFEPSRLMIGSDWPVCTVAAFYSGVIDIVSDYLNLYPTKVRDAVDGWHAQRSWRLDP